MKKIGIDARLYYQTGVGVYLRNLIHYLDKLSDDLTFYVYVLRKDADKIILPENFIKRPVNSAWHTAGEQVEFLREAMGDNLDLMHFTYFGYPVLYSKKFVVTIHDLTPVLFKTGKASTRNSLVFNLKHWIFKNVVLKGQVKNSSAIITPTKSVKKQLTDYYGSDIVSKITPIYEGVNYELFDVVENNKLAKEYKNFFLYVSNFYPHKNAESLINVFSKIKKDVNLVMVGPNDFFAKKMKKLVEELGQADRIKFYHNASIEDFVFFYKNAKALVHPSLSEGFGLPIVEAIYYNLPIIGSNIDVFKELLGDKYISFDPQDQKDMQKKLEAFIKKPAKIDYGNLIDKYSFEKMAKQTLEIYRKSL